MHKLLLLFSSLFFISLSLNSQTTFPTNGAPNVIHTMYAFTNCTLHVDADLTINNGTLLIQDGVIIRAGEKLDLPKEAVSIDLKGKHIYPSFIDLYSDYGMPELKRSEQAELGGDAFVSVQGINIPIADYKSAYNSYVKKHKRDPSDFELLKVFANTQRKPK